MRRTARPNNQQKRIDTERFYGYLETLEQPDRAEFIKWVAFECGVSRPVVYSWCYMCSAIPDYAKEIIERGAGRTLFYNV